MISNITAPIAIGLNSNYYSIKEADGFGSAGVEVVKWDRPGFHGIKTPRAFWRGRVIRLIIGIRGSTSSEYEQKRRELIEAFDFPRNGMTWLKFTTTGGLALQVQVQLNAEIQSVFKQGEVTIGEARIELIAEDPILYSQTLKTQDITFAAGSGVVANSGTAPVFPTVRVHGNVLNPSIMNSTLGRSVSLSGVTIAAGNYYDVDMLEETVEDPTGASVYNYVNDDDFFWLDKGNNTISLGGTPGGSGYRKVTLTYRDGYLGI
jgi:hypothetical protein